MEILEPKSKNDDKQIQNVSKNSLYISVTDYGSKSVLENIKIEPGVSTWFWHPVISRVIEYYKLKMCDFDKALTLEVHNPYSTVYVFNDFEEALQNWDKIKYVDKGLCFYTSEEK